MACSASAVRRSSRSPWSAPSASPSAETPMPIRRNLVPSVSRASRSRPAAKIRAASWVGWSSEWARVRMRKSAVLSLSVTVLPASSLSLRRAETFSDRRQSRSSSGRKSAMSWSNVVSAEMLLVSRSGLHRPVVECRGRAAPAARPRRRSGASIRSRRCAAGRRWCAARHAPAAAASPCRPRRSASPASAPGRRPLRRRRAPRSRAACRDRRRSWRGTCCRRARSTR